jgi:hypothetical protein
MVKGVLWKMRKGLFFILITVLLVLTGCMQSDPVNKAEAETKRNSAGEASKNEEETKRICPDGIIDWADFLKINGIRYSADYEVNNSGLKIEKGKKMGEVTYMLDGNACSDHKSEDGDAAYLSVGTEIYELKGYKSNFRIVADGKIYEVTDNPEAKTIGELFDIEGKVEKVGFASTHDGSHIDDFSEAGTKEFIAQFLELPYEGFEKVYKSSLDDKSRIFIDIHLEDGTFVRNSYWLDENVLNPGANGTKELKKIVLNENPPFGK